MKFSILARKSDLNDPGLERQVKSAKDWVAARPGDEVIEADIYAEDDITGRVLNRPGLNAFMAAVAQRPRRFDAVVMMASSRLARNMEGALPLQIKITRAGVRIFHYQDNQELRLDTPAQKLMAEVQNFSNEDYAYQVSVNTTRNLRLKFQEGHVVGGRLYGYRNVPQGDPQRIATGKWDSVIRVIDPAEAAVVVRIFRLYLQGLGYYSIATRLNGEGVKAPRAEGWSQGGIAGMLRNEHYIGTIHYGRTERVVTAEGKGIRPSQKPLLTLERPDLRIVDQKLWEKVQAELASRSGPRRRPRGRGFENGKYALSGLSQCATCGGSIRIAIYGSGHPPRRTNTPHYCCGTFRTRGTCANNVAVKAVALEAAVMGQILRYLDASIVNPAVDRAVARLVAQRGPDAERRAHLEREVAQLDVKGARLAKAIGLTDELAPLAAELQAVEQQKATIRSEIAALADTAEPVDATAVKRALAAYAKDLPELLAGTQARQVLKHLLRGRIRMEPYRVGRDKGYTFAGELAINRLIDGTSLSVSSTP